jgi:hypothetical protein
MSKPNPKSAARRAAQATPTRTGKAKLRPPPGSLYTHPAASIWTGKVDRQFHKKLTALPFVASRSRGKGRNFWSVKPSGSYFNDCEAGAKYADAFIPLLKYNFGVSMLGFIVCDMIVAGEKKSGKGLVVGFMGQIAREFSMTRQSLGLYAAAITPKAPSFLRNAAVQAAVPTIKSLGDFV